MRQAPVPPARPARVRHRWAQWLAPVRADEVQRNLKQPLVFPSLGTRSGCQDLMAAIRYRPNFCPQATWLVAGPNGCVGTVQGLLDENGYGGIQNLGSTVTVANAPT